MLKIILLQLVFYNYFVFKQGKTTPSLREMPFIKGE